MKKILFFLSVLGYFFATPSLQAQSCNAPIINSFSPNTGFIGSSVTIIGANFDAIPANNQVWFGATQATVQSASFGTLVVTVPVGASTAPIAVKNACNLTAYSNVSFNGIFCPTPINANTYNNTSFELGGVYGAYNMLAQDLDGDGKPEVVSAYTGITVAKNNSTPGNLNFTAINFGNAGNYNSSISTADFDGDGKRDLFGTYNIYRNTSTGPGNINFQIIAAPANSTGGYQGNVGDFNNDGKIDIVWENASGTMYVYMNTSTGPGNISFASAAVISVQFRCTGIQVVDVDGDGKVDILATQGDGNRLIALRNTTTTGASSFTFAPLQAFNSGGAYPYRCQIADFDKDGKIDLATVNYNSGLNTVNTAVFRNTSTVGAINFATVNTYPGPNNNYRIGVGDVNGDGYPDIVTKSLAVQAFAVYPNISSGPGNINFATRFDYSSAAASEVSGIVIGDLDGDYVPDIATSGVNSNTIRFHRNTSSQVDVTPPTAACKNIIVALSPSGTVTVTAAMIDNGSSDACGIGSLQINNSASITFTCANIGPNTVTLKVTDRAGNVSTCTATVTVAPAAIIVAGQTTVCQGQTVTMNANPGDSYQWQKDGVDIPGATSQTYVATVSGNYTVTVTNSGGCSGTSAATVVTVNNNPTVNTTPSGTASLCPPGNLTISASTSSIYQWKLNGNNISGATQQTYNATGAGSYSVQVVDLFGCSATSSPIVVNATDNIAPTAKCKNVTVIINAGGTASITVGDINNGSFDNCSVASVSITSGKTSYTCADAGQTFPVTLTVVDGSGNSSNCTAQVSVTDPNLVCNRPPVAVCQALTVSANANCEGTATAIDFDRGSSDPDAGDVLTFSVSPVGPYAKGTTSVTFTVTDQKGASSICSTTITVVDNQAPVMVCPASQTVNNNTNQCGAVITFARPTATDNCSGSAFNYFNPGEPNNAGGEDYLQLYNSGTWNDLPNYVNNRFIVEFNSVISTTFVNYNLIGTFGGHTYYISTFGASWTSARTNAQSIGGDLASINTLSEDQFLAPYGGSTWVGGYQDHADPSYVEPGNASQNFGGWKWVDGTKLGAGQIAIIQTAGLPSGSLFPIGTTVNTFTATDESGNTSTCSFSVTVIDNQFPTLFCPPAITHSADPGKCTYSFTPPTPAANDNCNGTTVQGVRSDALALNAPYPFGTTTITWTAKDASNNTVTCNQNVNVFDNEYPVIVGTPANITQTNDAVVCGAKVNWTAATATDNCAGVTISSDHQSGDLFPVGTTTVTYTATDAHGNSSNSSFTVTVTDDENPVILGTPANITQTNDAGVCGAKVNWTAATATDNCPGVTISSDHQSGDLFPVGTTTVTYTATDAHGNSSNSSFTVTVTDDENPVIVGTPSNISQTNDAGVCGAKVSWTAATATDNCPGVTISSDHQSGDQFPVGTTTVTYTATDAYGHIVTTSFTVTVTDDENPVIIGTPANITQTNDAGVCGAKVSWTAATATDNCPNVTISSDHQSGDLFPVGTTTVTYTATDAYSHTVTTSFTVTVKDNEAPIAKCKPVTVTLVNGAASITVADVNNNSTDNCAIASMTISKSSFNCSNIGANTVTLTVTDIYGNVSSCMATVTVVGEIPGCTIASIPSSNTYTGGVSTSLFLGYGAQSTTLKVTPSANGAPYTYAWSGSAVNMLSSTTSDAPVFTPTAAGTYTFTVVTTNKYGCTTSCSITICVTDIKVYSSKHDDDDDDHHDGDNDDDKWKSCNHKSHEGKDCPHKGHDHKTCDHKSHTYKSCPDDEGDAEKGDDDDKDDKKVYLCHVPNGNQSKRITLSISIHAVAYHLAKHPGDRLGSCDQLPCSPYTDKVNPDIDCPKDVKVSCTSSLDPSVTGMATASDNYSTVTITYSDVTVGNKVTRTWKATDVAGNFATCKQTITVGEPFSTNLSSVPNSNVNTGGVSTNLYLGYGAQSTTLKTGSLSNSGAPYTYAWTGSNLSSTSSSAPVFTPVAAGTFTFSVTITNASGCKYTTAISICVTDIRVPGTGGTKVFVCHTPKAKNSAAQTLQVLVSQVPSHLGSSSCGSNGSDRLGSCDQTPCSVAVATSVIVSSTSAVTKEVNTTSTTEEDLKVTVSPNPSNSYFTLKLESKFNTPVNMKVLDASGRVVDARSKIVSNSTIQIGHNYSSGTYYAEMTQGTTRKVIQLIKSRG